MGKKAWIRKFRGTRVRCGVIDVTGSVFLKNIYINTTECRFVKSLGVTHSDQSVSNSECALSGCRTALDHCGDEHAVLQTDSAVYITEIIIIIASKFSWNQECESYFYTFDTFKLSLTSQCHLKVISCIACKSEDWYDIERDARLNKVEETIPTRDFQHGVE